MATDTPAQPDSQDLGTSRHDGDNVPSGGLSRRGFIAAGSAGLAATTFAHTALAAIPSGYPGAGGPGLALRSHPAKRPPMVIQDQGSFAFGGTVITGSDGNTFHGDHGYAQFQIPQNSRNLPLVMWHGGGQMGKTWESTPDGREGYQNIFVRRGFSTYIIDQPRRGRAGKSTMGVTIPNAVPNEANLFTIFRLGVWTPPHPRRFFPHVQFPQDPASIDQYFRQVTPDTGPGGGGATGVGVGATIATDAVAALFGKVGPSVLVTHSASGILGWQTALKSDNVRAIVSYEPTVFVYPEGEPAPPPGFAAAIPVPLAEFKKLTKIPIQIVFGDNIGTELTGIFGIDLWVRSVPAAKAFVATLKAHGGDAEVLLLPEAGVFGNTHFPFSDLNNGKVADLLSRYLGERRLDRRGKRR
jgi:hypothetical protein